MLIKALRRAISTGQPLLQASVVRRAIAKGIFKPHTPSTTAATKIVAVTTPGLQQGQKQNLLNQKQPHRTVRSGALAIKKGMSGIWDAWGSRIPVTLLQLDNVHVTQIKKPQTDRYWAVQMGCTIAKPHRAGQSIVGHCTKAKAPVLRHIAEFKVTRDCIIEPGVQLHAAHFTVGQFVDVVNTSVGKGFQGAMKRWGFKGLPASHGVSVSHRSHGSTGQCQDPGRVFKNKKMAGRMGGDRITTQNMQVVKVDHDLDLLYVKGAVPGSDNSVVRVTDARKKYWDGLTPLGVAGPVPTWPAESAKTGEEWLSKAGKDPYLHYEEP